MNEQTTNKINEFKKFLKFTSREILDTPANLKPIFLTKNSFEKKIYLSLKYSAANDFIYHKYILKEDIRTLLLATEEIQQLPLAILKIKALTAFEACHVLVHEKGKPIGHNYAGGSAHRKGSRPIDMQSFNSLFNLIKKSKNKIFYQSLNLKDDLDIVGNFLAKEVDLKNYSVIYLISRNSLIPPTDEELRVFQLLSNFLPPMLTRVLNKENERFKKILLQKSLENFPEKIIVKEDSCEIFTNQGPSLLNPPSNLMMFSIDDTTNTILELSSLGQENLSTERHHAQRISLLGELLNTLQHELSNPLFGLSLTSSLLASDVDNEEAKSLLNDICSNAKHSQTIIKNFSNHYHDYQELKKIILYPFIEEIITLTKSETKEIFKKIECIGFLSSSNIQVKTNPTSLTQIVFNLIINAAQAIKSEKVRGDKNSIIIKLIKRNSEIQISVVDDGPGVREDLATSIFEPFFTTKTSGTGLGLSICQSLAQKIGSNIHFQNNSPFPGATFSINLPLIQELIVEKNFTH